MIEFNAFFDAVTAADREAAIMAAPRRPTAHEELAAAGYGHRPDPTDKTGKRHIIYLLSTGEERGSKTIRDAVEWVRNWSVARCYDEDRQ